MKKELFQLINRQFNGELNGLCTDCGGLCEKTQLAVFLPGEVDHTAEQIGLLPEDFIRLYCNRIVFEGKNVYILKAGFCPFLFNSVCGLRQYRAKLWMCLSYPMALGLKDDRITIFLDHHGCPKAEEVPDDFRRNVMAIYAVIKNKVPKYWLRFVSKFGEALYDYSKLEGLRYHELITLQELKACMIQSDS